METVRQAFSTSSAARRQAPSYAVADRGAMTTQTQEGRTVMSHHLHPELTLRLAHERSAQVASAIEAGRRVSYPRLPWPSRRLRSREI